MAQLSATPDHNFGHTTIDSDFPGSAQVRTFAGQRANVLSVLFPNHDREDLLWIGRVQIDESRCSIAVGRSSLTGDLAAHCRHFADMVSCVRG